MPEDELVEEAPPFAGPATRAREHARVEQNKVRYFMVVTCKVDINPNLNPNLNPNPNLFFSPSWRLRLRLRTGKRHQKKVDEKKASRDDLSRYFRGLL
jgi:hypothetical protein